MVKVTTVDKWGIPCIKAEVEDDGVTVVTIFCSVCRSYYTEHGLSEQRGCTYNLTEKWIEGTDVIKKCNATDHVTKSAAHKRAASAKQGQQIRQTTIPENVIQITAAKRLQLIKKFQLVHFVVHNYKPFTDFERFGRFEKDVHGVDIGSGYLTPKSAKEMTHFIAESIKKQAITDPLNNSDRRYFTLLYDGSSSAKTMDEREVYVIKTCSNGRADFQVLSLEEPLNCDAPGLKQALDNSIAKQEFSFERKIRQVGNGSDGAAVNNALFKLEQEELGPHLVKGWCANHKGELGIHDAFNISDLNKEAENLISNIYYLFKKANLKWRLFKKQAKFLGLKPLKYKRPTGTRWVSHQVLATSNFLRNWPVLVAFLHQQIHTPHNKTMADAKAVLQGHLKSVCRLEVLIFLAARQDILAYNAPFSQVLESKKLLAPNALSAMKNSVDTMLRISNILENQGVQALKLDSIFPTLAKEVWSHLVDDLSEHTPFRQTRTNDDSELSGEGSVRQKFHDYPMATKLNPAMNKVHQNLKRIVHALNQNLQNRYSDFLENPIFKAAAMLLDAKRYKFNPKESLYPHVNILGEHFETLLKANSCEIIHLQQELDRVHSHVTMFLGTASNEQIWPQVFSLKQELGIENILHLIEISIVLPLSSADVERIFSSFARLMSKDRLSLLSETLENLLIVRTNDFDGYKADRYKTAIDRFLEFYPDGTIRKRSARLAGHKAHRRPKRSLRAIKNKNCLFLPKEDMNEVRNDTDSEPKSCSSDSDSSSSENSEYGDSDHSIEN